MKRAENHFPEPPELEHWVDRAAALPGLDLQREAFNRLLADYRRAFEQGEGAMVLALVGATGAGKSTLLNALAGQSLAQEGVDRPTSRRAVVYAPRDAHLAALERLGAEVMRYNPQPGVGPWSGHAFVDTPDLNSTEPRHREIARAVLEQADVAVVVMHRGSVVEGTQVEFLREFARRRRLLFAINFADLLGPSAKEELRGQVARVAAEQLGIDAAQVPVFVVSALKARTGEGGEEFGALVAALKELGGAAGRTRIRRTNASGVLAELAERVRPAAEDFVELRQEAVGHLEKGFAEAADALSADFDERLQGASGYLAKEVRRQAAGRWWGPAAFWLRMSQWAAGGLGAAALLSRWSAPWGLATAAAVTLAEKVRDKTMSAAAQGRVVSAGDLTDDGGTLAAAARTALASARTLARSRGVEPAALALPDVPSVLEALASTRANAWAHAQGTAVAAAVARWWRWARFLLLPLVNLPLFALAAHVAYRVVRAYVFGPYLEANFFLNALALAVVLSLGGALLASLSLAGLARRVRVSARRAFEASLEELHRGLLEGTQAAGLDALNAAEALRTASSS